jgi:peptidoglycan/xylan/chitin deacetylase (PgdA/CDA1 family)
VNAIRLLVRGSVTLGLRLVLRLSARRAGLVLVYHALAEQPGDRDRELVAPHSTTVFERQLRHLQDCYRLVRADELPEAVRRRRRGERLPVAVTFDDDLPSHVELAAPILRRHGATATFFLCGASLDGPFTFWWQRLQDAYDEGRALPVEADGIHESALRIEAMTPAERAEIADRLGTQLGPGPRGTGLGAEQARALAESGCDIGFHTVRHDRLPGLDDEALEAALRDGRERLEAVVGRPLTTIAYPHGKADARVADAARAAGFRLGFTGRYEPVVPTTDPLLLGRIEPSPEAGVQFGLQVVRALLKRVHS